jgi:hypothetical protein
MKRDSEKTEFFSWVDRIGEAADFVNTDHLNLIDMHKPPLVDTKNRGEEEREQNREY